MIFNLTSLLLQKKRCPCSYLRQPFHLPWLVNGPSLSSQGLHFCISFPINLGHVIPCVLYWIIHIGIQIYCIITTLEKPFLMPRILWLASHLVFLSDYRTPWELSVVTRSIPFFHSLNLYKLEFQQKHPTTLNSPNTPNTLFFLLNTTNFLATDHTTFFFQHSTNIYIALTMHQESKNYSRLIKNHSSHKTMEWHI